ncbi:MAG: ATP-binding protein [Ornithinimicrobium sp.]
MSIVFGPDPVASAVATVIDRLRAGGTVDSQDERQVVDLKEEHGRRGRDGRVGPSNPQNQAAAKELAGAAACMANTPGGGALIVGVADDGRVIGTELDCEWLRHRIYELTSRALTVDVREHVVTDERILVMTVPRAIEPIVYDGKIRWRVAANCVEVDHNTWYAKRLAHLNYDWSAQESTVAVSKVSPSAIEIARRFLDDSGESHSSELSRVETADLLRRLNVVSGQGFLTIAGVLAFVGRQQSSVDYIRRDHAGGDSTVRIRRSGRSLLEDLSEVFQALEAHNSVRHVRTGLTAGQIRELPSSAAREAIVNGVAHREWAVAAPTVVEHIGRTVTVTSPGGFFGGVNEHNVLTHPSTSRNRSLTDLLAALRVAEREGIGVDRMVRDMLAIGHQRPQIREITGPFVRTSLIGDNVDTGWMSWLQLITPRDERRDVNSLIVLNQILLEGWTDVGTAAPILQLTVEEARGVLTKLAEARTEGVPVIARTNGVPANAEAAWHLTEAAASVLARIDAAEGHARSWPSRERVAVSYSRSRGRISSTELGSLVGASSTNVGVVLKGLEKQGLLAPAWPSRRGRGFYYDYIGTDA